jgi:hypothetical protein
VIPVSLLIELNFVMLPENDRATIVQFQQQVETVASLLSGEFDRSIFKTEVASLKSLFQNQIQSIETENYLIHSLFVEIDKQMRLFKMDAMFLQTARQSETAQQRIGQLRDRLQRLQEYCQGILAIEDA